MTLRRDSASKKLFRLSQTRRRRAARHQAARRRLLLESLEGRQLLAADFFVNDDWHFVSDEDSSGSLTVGDLVTNTNDAAGATVSKEYGVDGYGVVTSGAFTGSLAASDSIQDALDDAAAGEEVIVLEGTYTENLTISTDDITLSGHTGTATEVVIDASSGSTGIEISGSGALLQHLRVTGAVGDGVFVSNVDSVALNNVQLDAHSNDGFSSLDVGSVDLTDVTSIDNFRWGAYAEGSGSGDLTVLRGTFSDTAAGYTQALGIIGRNLNSVIATDVIAEDNTYDGIDVDPTGSVTISGGSYTGNGEFGMDFDDVTTVDVSGADTSNNGLDGINVFNSTTVQLTNVISNGNSASGFYGFNISGQTTITGGTFNNNSGDGLHLEAVGAVVTTGGVTATGNDPGVFISGAASYSDTDGVYSGNDDHGIQLIDIAGNVTLVRTTANNNDADTDTIGDGLNATDGGDGDLFAIGGNLLIQGGTFRDTDGAGAGVTQIRGVFVSNIDGNVTLEDAAAPAASMDVRGNRGNGVEITGDGANIATFTSGTYSSNAGDGIFLFDFDEVLITDVTANSNSDDGIELSDVATRALLDGITTSSNTDRGFVAMNPVAQATIELFDLTHLTNTSGFGGDIVNFDIIEFTTTTSPASTVDEVDLTSTQWQHLRAATLHQPVEYAGASQLSIFTLGGADTIQVASTAAATAYVVEGGDANDLVEIGSAGNSLDDILGPITVSGQANDLAPTNSLNGNVIPAGDTLRINDHGDADDNDYAIDATTITRTGAATITYATVETVEVRAGGGSNEFTISTTAGLTTLRIFSGDNPALDPDIITLENTGIGSNTLLMGEAGPDEINIRATALTSQTRADGGAASDIFNVGSLLNTVTSVLGGVEILGDSNELLPTITLKGNVLPEGDILNFNDQGNILPGLYTVTDSSVQRFGTAAINYATVETINVNTGSAGDDITISSTAASTNLNIFAGDGADTITLENTGATSNTFLYGQGGNDIITVEATAAGSKTEANGGDGDDTLGAGNVTNGLDDLLGEVCLFGDGPVLGPGDATHSPITIKGDSSGELYVGDTVNFLGAADGAGNTYTLTDTTLDRTGIPQIVYGSAETVNLTTSAAGASTAIVTTTIAGGSTTITSGAAADTVNVTTTGDDSNVIINSGGGADQVTITSTGIDGGDTNNDTGDNTLGSFLVVNAGAGDDTITLLGNGTDSRVQLNGQADNDTINIRATSTGSETEAFGGDGNDIFNIGSAASSLDDIDGIVCVEGEDHPTGPTHAAITIKGDSSGPLYIGDTVNFLGSGDGAGNTYTLTSSTLDRTAMAQITYLTIETVNLTTSAAAASTINVTSTVAGGTTNITSGAGADTVSVTTTGADSNVTINTAGGADTVTITSTGADGADANNSAGDNALGSFLVVNAGAGDDTITLLGNGTDSRVQLNGQADNDTINIRATSTGSETEAFGGDGNDIFNIGNAASSLDDIDGIVCVEGEDDPGGPTHAAITIKGDSSGPLFIGDTVNFLGSGDGAGNTYTLTSSTLDRTAMAQITYLTIETVNLTTSAAAASTINVTSTVAGGTTNITSGAGADTVSVTTTGADSNVTINTAGGADTVTITSTGADGADANNSAGDNALGSFLVVNAGAGDDTITLLGNGTDSRVQLNGQADNDTINIRATSTGSETEAFGGDGNDIFNIGSAASSLDDIDGIVCVEGEDDPGGPTHAAITIKGDSSGPLFIGDTVNFLGSGDGAGNTYTLTSSTLDRTAMAQITYLTIETVNLTTSAAAAHTINVTSTVAGGTTNITSGAGADTVSVTTTGADSNVTINTAGGADTVTITSTGADGADANNSAGDNALGSFLVVNAGAGDDTITLLGNGTDSRVQLNGQADNDTINIRTTSTGSETEAFGGDGNDIFNIGSAASSLDDIDGIVCVEGEDDPGGPTHAAITIKGDSSGPLFIGDTVNFLGSGDGAGNTYTLTSSTLDRTAMALITYLTIETVNLTTSAAAASTINVTSTVAGGTTNITSGAAADTVSVTTTGADSNVTINTAGGADTVTITSTGADGADANNSAGDNALGSFLVVNAGAGDDTITLLGNGTDSRVQLNGQADNDTINIRTTSTGSETEAFGGDGNDIFNIGNAASSLDDIDGIVCVEGADHPTGPTHAAITIKGDSSGPLFIGDTVNFLGSGDGAGNTYTLTPSTLDRTAMAQITYLTIETVNLTTSAAAASTINVTSTVAGGTTNITSGAGADSIDVTTTGDDSNVTISSAGGDDDFTIDDTGVDGADSNNAGGDNAFGSFLLVLAGSDDDTATLNDSGARSRVEIQGSTGEDLILVFGTGASSVTNVLGQANNDTIHVGNSVTSLSTIATDSIICVDGGGQDADPRAVSDPRTVLPFPYNAGSTLSGPTTTNELVGDTLQLNDSGANVYQLDGDDVRRVGGPQADYTDIETLIVNSTTGDDQLTVDMHNGALPYLVKFLGGDGDDHLVVRGSAAADNITVNAGDALGGATIIGGAATADTGPYSVNSVECLHLIGNRGADNIVNNAHVPALIEGRNGRDTLVGSSQTDILFAGPGVDALFGRGGDDFLFADTHLTFVNGVPTAVLVANDPAGLGDLLDGGNGINSGAQFGTNDIVRKINGMLLDGGAQKDVVTWLRAQLMSLTPATLQALVDKAFAAIPCQFGPVVIAEPEGGDEPLNLEHNMLQSTDVNGNGFTNASDVTALIRHMLQGATGEDSSRQIAWFPDVNNDTRVNSRDVRDVITTVLRGENQTPAMEEGESYASMPSALESFFAAEEPDQDPADRWNAQSDEELIELLARSRGA